MVSGDSRGGEFPCLQLLDRPLYNPTEIGPLLELLIQFLI